MDEAAPIIDKTTVDPGTPRYPAPLLALDRLRWLAGHIVHRPIHALDLVDDADRGAGQEAHNCWGWKLAATEVTARSATTLSYVRPSPAGGASASAGLY
jgi:hypothetical protein